MSEPLSEAARIFGDRVREERQRLALSQEEVAHLAGMNVSNYGKIERGMGNPQFHTLVRIASVLGIDLSRLVRGLQADMIPSKRETYTAADFVRERRGRASAS